MGVCKEIAFKLRSSRLDGYEAYIYLANQSAISSLDLLSYISLSKFSTTKSRGFKKDGSVFDLYIELYLLKLKCEQVFEN